MSEMLQRAEEEGDYDVGVVLVRPILDPTFAGQLLSLPTEVVSNVSDVRTTPPYEAMSCIQLASVAPETCVCLLDPTQGHNSNTTQTLSSAKPDQTHTRLLMSGVQMGMV